MSTQEVSKPRAGRSQLGTETEAKHPFKVMCFKLLIISMEVVTLMMTSQNIRAYQAKELIKYLSFCCDMRQQGFKLSLQSEVKC